MIMRHCGARLSCTKRLFQRIKSPSDKTYAHTRTISEPVIRLRIICEKPYIKPTSISCIKIPATIILHYLIQCTSVDKPLSNSYCHYRIISERRTVSMFTPVYKQFKISTFHRIKFINRADNITRSEEHTSE